MNSYIDALEKLGNRQSRKLENNTYLQRRINGIAVMLHSTDIVLFKLDGSIILNPGAWRTRTTKERINKYSPAHVMQKRGQWILQYKGRQFVWIEPTFTIQDEQPMQTDSANAI